MAQNLSVSLKDVILNDMNFSELELPYLFLRNTSLTNASFVNSNLEHADFSGSVLAEVSFTGAKLDGANFLNTQLQNTHRFH